MVKNIIGCLVLAGAMLVSITGFGQNTAAMQKEKDERLLRSYFASKKINPSKTASGLYYLVTKKGSGENAKPGQRVSMKYLGTFLDGKKFDANVDDNFNSTHPFSFILGMGQVIKGWDEGVQLLSPGTRATLYLPSGLAYGESGRGPIPPNSVLVFDVELVSIDK